MPKSLFYLGVIFSMLAALLLLGAVVDRGLTGDWLEVSSVQLLRGSTTRSVLAVMLLSIPVAGFFLRIASLIAPRNLFAAFFAIFATCSAAVSAGLYAGLDFRASLYERRGELTPGQADNLDMMLELRLATLWALGFFLATMFLATRPYFRLHGRALPIAVAMPLPVFLLALLSRYAAPDWMAIVSLLLTGLLLALFALLLVAAAVHGLRHRHLFIELTNLRELLDGRLEREQRPAREFPFSGGVAYDPPPNR